MAEDNVKDLQAIASNIAETKQALKNPIMKLQIRQCTMIL